MFSSNSGHARFDNAFFIGVIVCSMYLCMYIKRIYLYLHYKVNIKKYDLPTILLLHETCFFSCLRSYEYASMQDGHCFVIHH